MHVEFIKHSQLSNDTLTKIVLLKKTHWDYTVDEHLKWLSENINDNDLHVLLFDDENILLAYMNMVHIKVKLNFIENNFLGIGNVCVSDKNRGFGSILFKEVNKFLNNNNYSSILLCKKELVPFYKSNNWLLLEAIKTSENLNQMSILVFNVLSKVDSLTFEGKLF